MKPKHPVLITGASGFIGKALVRSLNASEFDPIPVYRRSTTNESSLTGVYVDRLHCSSDWDRVMKATRPLSVVHLAARTHVVREQADNPANEFETINVIATERLATSAAAHGVKRFVFLSSIKVNGETTAKGGQFHSEDIPAPEDEYGRSKLEAERRLRDIAEKSGMEFVIVRPPLVYGPGVKANFRSLIALCDTSLPLPFYNLSSKRSLVFLGNLIDLLQTCLRHDDAPGNIILVSDGEAVSVCQLIRSLREALGRDSRLVPFPRFLLRYAAVLTNNVSGLTKLTQPLEVNIAQTRQILGWRPPVDFLDALQVTVDAYHDEKNR